MKGAYRQRPAQDATGGWGVEALASCREWQGRAGQGRAGQGRIQTKSTTGCRPCIWGRCKQPERARKQKKALISFQGHHLICQDSLSNLASQTNPAADKVVTKAARPTGGSGSSLMPIKRLFWPPCASAGMKPCASGAASPFCLLKAAIKELGPIRRRTGEMKSIWCTPCKPGILSWPGVRVPVYHKYKHVWTRSVCVCLPLHQKSKH